MKIGQMVTYINGDKMVFSKVSRDPYSKDGKKVVELDGVVDNFGAKKPVNVNHVFPRRKTVTFDYSGTPFFKSYFRAQAD